MVYIPPTFDDVVNDLTGASVTLTITPPNDAGYVQTNIFYRRTTGPNGIPVGLWSSGGTYIGAAGVQGMTVVSGLEADQIYEFILTAESATDYSPPTVTRAVLVSSSGKAVKDRILDDVAAWCATITQAAGYNFDVRQVEVFRVPGQSFLDEYPGVIVYEAINDHNDKHPQGAVTQHAMVFVEGWFRSFEDVDQELELWEADLNVALLKDRRRGGDAVTTHIRATQKAVSQGSSPFGGVFFELDVMFRTDYGNPYQRR